MDVEAHNSFDLPFDGPLNFAQVLLNIFAHFVRPCVIILIFNLNWEGLETVLWSLTKSLDLFDWAFDVGTITYA